VDQGGAWAQLHPIRIEDPLGALQLAAGSVDALPVTVVIRNEARTRRDEVPGRRDLGRGVEHAQPAATTAAAE
jgi:hypothetical protein